MERINVLYIVPSLNQADGISSYAMNYFRHMKNVTIDFLITSTLEETDYCREVISKGNKVFYIKSNEIRNIINTCKDIDSFFKKYSSQYDIVHCHVASLALPYLHYAKKYNVNTRILHAHATKSADTFMHRIRNDISSIFTMKLVTDRFACSKAAGEALFRNKSFRVIHNAIDVSKYRFSSIKRNKIRTELGIDNQIVIGNVGRLSIQKNQEYLIEIAKYLKLKTKQFVFLVIGNGEQEQKLKEKSKKYKVSSYFMFLGARNDVMDLYNAMDVFVLPSLFEGLPVVGIEAQCNGLPCVFSKGITKEVAITKHCTFLDINEEKSLESWGECILNYKNVDRKQEIISEYNIESCSKNLEQIYQDLILKNGKN